MWLFDRVEPLGDRVHGHLVGRELDVGGIVHLALGDPARAAVQGRAEEHGLAGGPGRQHGQEGLDVGEKAHVEEAVGLVDDEIAEVLELEVAAAGEVEETARSADDDVDALAEQGDLAVVAHAAEEDADDEGQVLAQDLGLALDLDGQLAGRGDDEGFPPARTGIVHHALEDGDEERGGLARSGLGLHGDIPALEGERKCLGLDVRGGDISVVGDAPLQVGVKVQFSKIHNQSLIIKSIPA